MMDLEPLLDAHIGKDAANGRMFDLRYLLDQLHARIDDLRLVLEEGRQMTHADVAIFVDRGSDHRTAVLLEPVRIVSATAEQRNAKWCTADDHGGQTE